MCDRIIAVYSKVCCPKCADFATHANAIESISKCTMTIVAPRSRTATFDARMALPRCHEKDVGIAISHASAGRPRLTITWPTLSFKDPETEVPGIREIDNMESTCALFGAFCSLLALLG